MRDATGEDRPIEPTRRRVERARRAGQVAFSRELVAAFVVALVGIVLIAGGRVAVGQLVVYLRTALGGDGLQASPAQAMATGFSTAVALLAVPLGTACVAAILGGLAQTRGGLSGARPWRGMTPLKRLPRPDVVGLLLDLGKLGLLSAGACWMLGTSLAAVLRLHGASAWRVLTAIGVMAQRLGVFLAVALIGLGLADYLLQVRRQRARLRMTREEARREYREEEGDAAQKAERRRRHHDLQMESGSLQEATLVLVDPGREVIAITYSGQAGESPVLLARGEDLLARRVEALAQAAGVPIVIDPTLVAVLSGTTVGAEIPEDAYQPVAERMVWASRHPATAGTPSTSSSDRSKP